MGQFQSRPHTPSGKREADAAASITGHRVCEDCQRASARRVDVPGDDPTTSEGRACAPIYAKVEACMRENNGQISPCSDVWLEFKKCRDEMIDLRSR